MLHLPINLSIFICLMAKWITPLAAKQIDNANPTGNSAVDFLFALLSTVPALTICDQLFSEYVYSTIQNRRYGIPLLYSFYAESIHLPLNVHLFRRTYSDWTINYSILLLLFPKPGYVEILPPRFLYDRLWYAGPTMLPYSWQAKPISIPPLIR